MRILAFDCAGAQCAAAILEDGGILAQRRMPGERGHAQFLIPLLNDTLADAGLTYGDLDRLAVTTGPGSFTGIRVALAAAQGLAIALDVPVVGVTVFEAMAEAAACFGTPRLLVAVESRREELFVQLADAAGGLLDQPAMLQPADIAAWAGPGALTLVGDAAIKVAPFLPDDAHLTGLAEVDCAALARVAARREPGALPAPFYMRPPDAKPRAA
jgi:tRNA threonylcarbamoyladenosine biosynthesis protein TsaB